MLKDPIREEKSIVERIVIDGWATRIWTNFGKIIEKKKFFLPNYLKEYISDPVPQK